MTPVAPPRLPDLARPRPNRLAALGLDVRTDDHPEVDEDLRDEPYDEQDDDPTFWSTYPAAGWWPPGFYWGDDESADDGYADGEYVGPESADGSWWDEGLITGLVVVGLVLFIVPEPATSAIGVLLMATGVALWVADLLI